MKTRHILVFQIEREEAFIHAVKIDPSGKTSDLRLIKTWKPEPYCSAPSGDSLLSEIANQYQSVCKTYSYAIDAVALTIPGTLLSDEEIGSSSRLGIFQPTNVHQECNANQMPRTWVVNDIEAMAFGQMRYNVDSETISNSDMLAPFVYVFVDEGVGSAIFIDGEPYRGIGVAGHLGRFVLEPSGIFEPMLSTRGSLEIFASRPWLSRHLVEEYLADKDMFDSTPRHANPFRAAVSAIAKAKTYSDLPLETVADGLAHHDPIAQTVVQDSARHLSVALNAIVTIVNPKTLILAGGLIEKIPGYYEMSMSFARRNAWADAWNNTTFSKAPSARKAQVLGAASLINNKLNL